MNKELRGSKERRITKPRGRKKKSIFFLILFIIPPTPSCPVKKEEAIYAN